MKIKNIAVIEAVQAEGGPEVYRIKFTAKLHPEQAASILMNLAIQMHRNNAQAEIMQKSNIVDMKGENFLMEKN